MPLIDVAQSIPCTYEDNTTPFGIACLLFSGRLVRDRFNLLNQYSNFNWIQKTDPIPEASSETLAELMDKRANELLGKSITVQWSGGVDSTSLLLSLIKNGISKEDLLVFYDDNSVSEYPKLFNWLQDQKYNTKCIKNWRKALGSTQTDIITNGWCADQLFGSIFFHDQADKYYYSIDKLLSGMRFEDLVLTEDQVQFATETYKKAAQKLFNIDLTLASELGWFINFCLKWTWVSSFNELYLLNTPAAKKTRVFYNTPYFQSWSLGNFPKIKDNNIYGKSTLKYKYQLKKYCYEIFPDDDYLNNKTKKPSWNATLNSQTSNQRIITVKTDTGYERIIFPDFYPINTPINFTDQFFTKFKK